MLQLQDSYSGHSFRLLALAVGVLPHAADLDIAHMPQTQIEALASPLQLLGVMVVANPIKDDSKETVTELQDRWELSPALIT